MISHFFFDLSLIHVINLNHLDKKMFFICHFGEIEKLNPKYIPTIPFQCQYCLPYLGVSVQTSFTFLLALLYFYLKQT